MVYRGPPGFPPSPIPPFGVSSPEYPAVIPGICGPVARPPTTPVCPVKKQWFTVYVGKIAPTADNDFILSLLQACGPVKSWKRAEISVDGTSRGFGFCEFESAEGSLRAMRLLNNLSVDGQELVLNIDKATKEYLEKYDEKKSTNEKVKEAEAEGKDGLISLGENENFSRTVPNVPTGTGDGGQKRIRGNRKRCWNVTEENSDIDSDAMGKIRSMIEERIKSKLLGPPTSPVQLFGGTVDGSGDEDNKKKRQRSSAIKERNSRRVCEKEVLEEGEFSKAERKAMGLQRLKHREVAAAGKSSLQIDVASSMHISMERESTVEDERKNQHRAKDGFHKKNDEGMSIVPGLVSDKRYSSARAEKLGFGPFGLIGSRKLTFVPAAFVEEDNNDTVEKRVQPLVPIDYSSVKLQSVQGNSSTRPSNFLATVEFSKHISGSNSRVERSEGKDRSGRRSDKSRASERDTKRNEKYGARVDRVVNERRKYIHDQEKDRQGTSKSEDKTTWDARRTVPKTKEELFACDVNWEIYDKHKLHERMRPWISKKAIEYFGEEVADFVDYVVTSTKEHVGAPRMMQLLESILDHRAENFVLLMWRKLIFEISRVET